MKIAEMKNCIEKMREIYKFDDEKTEIALEMDMDCMYRTRFVKVRTIDENGTQIVLARRADELVERE